MFEASKSTTAPYKNYETACQAWLKASGFIPGQEAWPGPGTWYRRWLKPGETIVPAAFYDKECQVARQGDDCELIDRNGQEQIAAGLRAGFQIDARYSPEGAT